MPAIWITVNPNDINNPVKMRLSIHRLHEHDTAKELLADLRGRYDRIALSTMDPVSAAIFFHREISLFFEKYVRTGQESIFGKISHYYATVETNDRGSLHLHGLLWLEGNMQLPSLVDDMAKPDEEGYRAQVVRYLDSVFNECLDEEAGKAVRKERKPIDPVEGMMHNTEALAAVFDKESNYIAYCCQVHSHTYTCIKYSLKGLVGDGAHKHRLTPCRFKAPWKIVEESGFTEDGLLKIRRNHPLVNRYNKAMAVGLRHNHDVSMILTKTKGLAMVFYITNYATKLDTPMWKRLVFAADVLRQLRESAALRGPNLAEQDAQRQAVVNESRQFLASTQTDAEEPSETVQFRESGRTLLCLDAYAYRGPVLRDVCLYDYMSMITLERRRGRDEDETRIALEGPPECYGWIQKLRQPPEYAVPIFQGFISDDHIDEHPVYFKRNSVLHLALFVPWENFLSETRGDITGIWRNHAATLCPRLRSRVANISLLRKSAEDALLQSLIRDFCQENPTQEDRPVIQRHYDFYQQIRARQDSLLSRCPIPSAEDVQAAAKAQDMLHLRMLNEMEGGVQGDTTSIGDADTDDLLVRQCDADIPIPRQLEDSAVQRPRMVVEVGSSRGFVELGLLAASSYTLNDLQSMALQLPPMFSEAKKWMWKQKLALVIDEVSMLGGATLFNANCRLQALRDCPDKPFGGIPIVLLMGDFYQFAPVLEATIAHHRGHSLWLMFKTVILLEEQVRARDDPQLGALLDRVRAGTQTIEDLDLLNTKLVDRSQITFKDDLRAITPLNRNRWSLNMEAVVDWARFHQRHISIFVSAHTWRSRALSQQEVAHTIEQGDNSNCKIPGVFFYAQGMPVVVNKNTYTGLKVVNGAEFTAADVIPDTKSPGYHLADDVTIHFGPPLGIFSR
ncbi:PIF1-like helicase [Hirsutella rhossiliensis]|uniref:ATP-dependent DNA helicase n=1 Tax=Hirsutella rhossiliensis TaxID=111463 RepID=A0A9P8SNC5_9HYPO|nr:PIF1-like helicase domain-containing protein [Hirsutella rhossiliensis]KAH0968911.1 PIF1-like helicase domain-containing protein [Hirsutella rhossiliensis]